MIFKKWKDEWLKKKEVDINLEFDSKIKSLMANWQNQLKTAEDSIEAKKREMDLKELEIDIITKTLDERKIELQKTDSHLREQIRLLEAKASPTNVWCEAFSLGFSKAWDMMLPLQLDGIEKMKKSISDNAISETLRRMNANKKIN